MPAVVARLALLAAGAKPPPKRCQDHWPRSHRQARSHQSRRTRRLCHRVRRGTARPRRRRRVASAPEVGRPSRGRGLPAGLEPEVGCDPVTDCTSRVTGLLGELEPDPEPDGEDPPPPTETDGVCVEGTFTPGSLTLGVLTLGTVTVGAGAELLGVVVLGSGTDGVDTLGVEEGVVAPGSVVLGTVTPGTETDGTESARRGAAHEHSRQGQEPILRSTCSSLRHPPSVPTRFRASRIQKIPPPKLLELAGFSSPRSCPVSHQPPAGGQAEGAHRARSAA